MALEQWEIDLRNQLAGIPTRANAPAPEPITRVVVKTKAVVPKWLLVVFIGVMVLGTLYNYQLRTGKQIFAWPKVSWQPAFVQEIHDLSAKTDMLRQDLNSLADKTNAIEKRTKLNNDRVAMLGALHNEQEISRIRGDGTTILFNQDWTINKMPKYLKLEPDDRQFLQERVKP